MRARRLGILAFVVTGLATVVTPAAALAYDEATDGDLSTDASVPTPLVFGLGVNVVSGRVTRGAVPDDPRDFLTFTIPAGRQLTGLRLVSWGGDNTGFHAINAGATSFEASTTNENNLLGGDHIFPIAGPTELLAELLDGDTAGVGTTAPLGPGTYSYVIQQTGPQLSDYRLEFVVSAAPAAAVPASDHKSLIALTLTFLAVMLVGRRRSRPGA
jgi:hypothetical protein